jgi:hypothetical protein
MDLLVSLRGGELEGGGCVSMLARLAMGSGIGSRANPALSALAGKSGSQAYGAGLRPPELRKYSRYRRRNSRARLETSR